LVDDNAYLILIVNYRLFSFVCQLFCRPLTVDRRLFQIDRGQFPASKYRP